MADEAEKQLPGHNPDAKVQEQTECEEDKIPITTTTTKNALITTQMGPCETYPHRLKVSIVGAGKVGMACAIAILMRRIASEICLIDQDGSKASAEAEDIQHAAVFLGNPLITGTKDISKLQDSAVVIVAACDRKPTEEPSVKQIYELFKQMIPAITRFACKAVLLIVTEPIDVMSYIAFKLSKFPSNRVLGTGTLLDSARFQDMISQRLGLARTSVNCMSVGAQGDTSVPLWSNVNVAGLKLRDINSRMGEEDDPEKWYEVTETVHKSNAEISQRKGEKGACYWALGICTAEIVDAIVRNTKVVLPVSTYIRSCSHGTDKDVYMSIPCVIGGEGVHRTVRQKLTEQEKAAMQLCADNIRNVLRECGILQETNDRLEN